MAGGATAPGAQPWAHAGGRLNVITSDQLYRATLKGIGVRRFDIKLCINMHLKLNMCINIHTMHKYMQAYA